MAEIRDNLIIDIDDAMSSIDELERALNRALTDIAVKVDTRAAQTQLDNLDASIPVNVDTVGVGELEASLESSRAAAAAVETETRGIASGISDSSDATKTLDSSMRDAAESASKITDSTSDITPSVDDAVAGINRLKVAMKAVAIVTAVGVAGKQLFDVGKAYVDLAGTLESATNRVKVTFGEFAADVLAFGGEAPTTLGLTESAALQSAASFGALFQRFGEGEAQSAALGVELASLAADVASLYGADQADVADSFLQGLEGSGRNIREFGVSIDQAATDAEVLRLGLADTSGEISDAAEVMANYSIIVGQASRAQGDFAANADSVINAQRRQSAEFDQAKTKLGQSLIPVFDVFIDVMPGFVDALTAATPALSALALSLAGLAAPAEAVTKQLPTLVVSAIDVAGAFVNLGSAAVNLSQAGISLLRGDVAGFAENLKDTSRASQNFFGTFVGADTLLRDFTRQIADGAPELDLFASAMLQLATEGELTVDRLREFSTLSGLGPTELAAGLQAVIETGGIAGDQVAILIDGFLQFADAGVGAEDTLRAFIQILSDAGVISSVDKFTNILGEMRGAVILQRARAGLADTVGDISEASRSGSIPVELFTTDLQTLVGAMEAGATFQEFVQGLRDVEDGASGTGDTLADTGSAFLTMAADVISAAQDIDGLSASFVGVVDGLEEVADHAHQAGTQINVTAGDFTKNIEDQVKQMEEFQGRLTLLAIDFPNLAEQLFSQGPEVTEIAKDFLSDPILAQRAEDLLQGKGTEVGDEYAAQIAAALEGFDFFSPAGQAVLNFTSELNSPQNIAAVSNAFNDLLASALVDVNANLGTLNITNRVPGRGGLRPADDAQGYTNNTTVNIVNAKTQDVETSARQAGAIIDSTRTLGRGFVGQ